MDRRTLMTWALGIAALCSGCNEPQNYDDCILEYVKAGMTERAVMVVRDACREKFPEELEPDPTERDLTVFELLNLTGRAGLSLGKTYSGTAYNGNREVVVTELQVTVTTTTGGSEVPRTYVDSVYVQPQSAGDFSFDIIIGDTGASYEWIISGAKGHSIQ